jgi:hypothetical protein
MSNIVDVWNCGRHRNKAHSGAARLHARYNHFKGASSRFIKNVDLGIVDVGWKSIIRAAYFVDEKESYLREEMAVARPAAGYVAKNLD